MVATKVPAAMMVFQVLQLGVLILLGINGRMVTGQAHATFYGGTDASGTMGGACGYGNLYSSGYGTSTAALSGALFNNGLMCGACYTLTCDLSGSSYCYAGASITVTATNLCPQGSYGGWCDSPKEHFDLAYPMFTTLAQAVGGVIPVTYTRTPCVRTGGVRFTINGNAWYFLVLVTNVAGGGDVSALSVKGDNTGWFILAHSWGENWTGDATAIAGQGLSFQPTLGGGATLFLSGVAGAGWTAGQTYESIGNF